MLRTAIKSEIDQRGWSISKLAKESGIRYPSLTEFIKGRKNLESSNIEKILKVLNLKISQNMGKLEFIWCYDTMVSFGLGACHFSVRTDGEKLFWFMGTPMCPERVRITDMDEDVVKDIKSTGENAQGMEYLKHKYSLTWKD